VLGRLLDAWSDQVFWASYQTSIGLLVYRSGGGLFGRYAVYAGLIIALIFLLQAQLRDVFALQNGRRAEFSSSRPAKLSFAAKARIAVIGLERVYAPGLIVSGLLGRLDVFLLAVLVYTVLIAAGAVFLTLQAAARPVRVSEPAGHGAPPAQDE
jgi:hypothetical protein